MTDLEKRAKNYIDDKALVVLSSRKDVVDLIVDFAKSETTLLSQHILDLQKDKGNLTDKVRELEQQIDKMKCCINDLVHLGEFNEHTDEEYFNYQVHEALNNAEQFIKEIKEK